MRGQREKRGNKDSSHALGSHRPSGQEEVFFPQDFRCLPSHHCRCCHCHRGTGDLGKRHKKKKIRECTSLFLMYRSPISLFQEPKKERECLQESSLSFCLNSVYGFGFQPSLQPRPRDTGGGRGDKTESRHGFIGSLQGSFLPGSACYLTFQSPQVAAPHIPSRGWMDG